MRRAFTLVELLVVVTIIIILIALLVPAIDRAMYQARMAVCGANLRSMGWMVTSYAQDNRKYYPARNILIRPMSVLSTPSDDGTPAVVNDRGPLLRGGLPINKIFNDPLSEEIDIVASLDASELELPYNLWWGFRYINNGSFSEEGMYRLNGRFTYTPDASGPYRFNVLASDLEAVNGSGTVPSATGTGTAFSSHPDADGVMVNVRLQNEVEPNSSSTTTNTYTYTKWTQRYTGGPRRPVDLNYVRTDMAVIRHNAVTYDEQFKGGRMVNVPWLRSVANNFSFIVHLPRE